MRREKRIGRRERRIRRERRMRKRERRGTRKIEGGRCLDTYKWTRKTLIIKGVKI